MSVAARQLTTAFPGFSDRMAQACNDIRIGDGEVTGADPLADRVHGFAGSWHYGLSQHGAQCVKMLHEVGSTFDRLDHELASELHRGKGKS